MEKHYDPHSVEAKWYPWWEERGFFHGSADQAGEPYSIVIPPPNVTGILHMGHALNETIQDILIRWRRMQGRNVVWMPGTDHAGIATQNVVEKALKSEGKTRNDLGREKFVERVWEWRKQYGGTIVRQQRSLGCSCDWQRERFTMDEGLSEAVAEVFCRLYDEGLIYKGNYIVNWCPRCGTALADDEVEHEPHHGSLWYVRYPVSGSEKGVRGEPYKDYIMVATTRPETLPGDTAVAVNPKDERYLHLHGKKVILPLTGREIPVIADDYVEREFGTGIVKITPAHDPNDFMVGKRHGLEEVNIMNGDGSMNELAGAKYAGMDRFDCRKALAEDLESGGFLDHVEDYDNQVGHCYRCHTVVESRLSKQWFVKMRPLAEPAIEAVKSGKVRFTPQRWEKTYFEWMENIRDWCISRQIWWGHRVPVYTCEKCGHEWAAKSAPVKCPKCGAAADAISQDPDVMDTWFSSWLWPFSTFGWPKDNPDLRKYYPTDQLVTAPDIIFFWVARMIMAGCKFMGDVPFRNVYLHGTVRDSQGRKMSKSLGNSLDPIEIISEYSADSLRFSLMMITSTGMDVYVDKNKFEIGRNFGTKIWNAARFINMRSEGATIDWEAVANGKLEGVDASALTDDDRQILAKTDAAIRNVTAHLEAFRFQDAARAIYDFVWGDVCDWYIEYAKGDLCSADGDRHNLALTLLTYSLASGIKLLHPFMPFLTEELWHQMCYCKESDTIMLAKWPEPISGADSRSLGISDAITAYVDAKHAMITAGRALRADYNIPNGKAVKYIVQAHSADTRDRLARDAESIKALLKASELEVIEGDARLAMPSALGDLGAIYLPLEGLVDIDAEKKRIQGELEKARGFLKGVDAKLGNAGFMAGAPANVVETTKQKKIELETTIERLARMAEALG